MKKHYNIKLIAASVALAASVGAQAGLGGLNVHSRLGEPFAATITVTGDEAKELLGGGKATISNGNLRASVRKTGDKAIVSIRSAKAVRDPVLIFQVGVGAQSREYTAIIDPADYNPKQPAAASGHARADADMESASAVNTRPERRPTENKAKSASVQKPNRPAKNTDRKSSQPASAKNSQSAAAKNSPQAEGREARYGSRHLVRTGETLMEIAMRIRPQGMTIEQTLHALVAANPQVFIDNNADKMLAGKVLDIPNRSQLQSLASKPLSQNAKAAAENAAGSGNANPPADKAEEPAKPAKPVEQTPAPAHDGGAATQAQTEERPVSQEASGKQDSDKQEMPAQASEPAAEILPASDPVSEEAASQPADQEASTAISEAVKTPEVSNDETEGEGGLWRWIALGGVGLIALIALFKAISRRKGAAGNDQDNDADDVVIAAEKTTSSAGLAAARAFQTEPQERTAVQTAAGGLEVEDDFEDDADDIAVNHIEAADDREEIDFDLGGLDNAQGGIVSGAVTTDKETEERRDADWENIESTESVYEPEPENPYNPVSVVMPEREEPASEVSEEAESFETESDKDDGAWDFDIEETQNKEDSKPAPAFSAEWGDTYADSKAEEVAEDEHEPLAFELEEKSGQDDLKLFDVQSAEEVALQDSETQENLQEEEEGFKVEDAVIEWDQLDVDEEESFEDAGDFVSESVGMTAPLEAKYELAKMYIEIGDPDAAKETLQELLEESDGEILAKTKELMKELDI